MSRVSACVDALNRCQPEDLENLWEINWLSLMELAFSSLFPFGPHYSPLSFLVPPSSPSSSAFRCSVRALPPPAGSRCERFSHSQAAEDREGDAVGAHHQGEWRQQCLCQAVFLCSEAGCAQIRAVTVCVFWTYRTRSTSCRPSSSRAPAEQSFVADRTFCCRRESLCRY